MIRLNRHENIQLEARLHILEQQRVIAERNYDRDIGWKRSQLAQIHQTLNDSSSFLEGNYRIETPVSYYRIRMQRHQSAPAHANKKGNLHEMSTTRPKTTPNRIRSDKRAMSVFKDITLKASCPTVANMLVLLDDDKPSTPANRSFRSRTKFNVK
jgi:hypothetical protein